jgi:importin-5
LAGATDKGYKLKLADVVIAICENTYENEEEWVSLLEYIVAGFNSELNQNNLLLIETSVYILSKIFGFVYEELTKGIDLYVKAFNTYFTSDNLSLKTKTVQAIGEILCIVRKKDSKKFKDFMLAILETTLRCFEKGLTEENNLKLCLNSICDLATAEPNILRKSFDDLFILMGKIIEKKDYADETIRELAFEILMSMIEKKESLISKNADKLKLFIEVIYKFALEMEDDVTDDWLTPKTESYFDEEFVPEEKLETALSLIDRLMNALGSKTMLAYLSDIVLQLLSNGGNDWRYKYIGFMTIAGMVEYVDDIVNLDNILPQIFKESENENPKIRYACLHCISQISDHLNPQFQNNYHTSVMPVALARLQNDPVLRVRLQACDSIQTYVEFVSDQVATTYCQNILDTAFSVFLKGDGEIPVSLREAILNVISELVTACGENFKPYAEKCLSFLLNYFSEILKTNSNKSLYGIMLDTITVIGPKCEEQYNNYLPDLVAAVIQIQNNVPNTTDPILNYLHNAWERLIPIIKDKHLDMAPQIIECTLKLVSNAPTMSIASQPEKKFDIQELLGGLNDDGEKKITIEKQKISLSTSETQDFAGSLELLNIIVETFSEKFLPFLELTQTKVFPLLTYEVNSDVRAEASNCLPELFEVVKKNSEGNTENLHKYAKLYISELIQALEKETDNSCIATFLDNIGGIVEKTGMFLMTNEINILFGKLLDVFNKVEKSRISLLQKKDQVEDEINKEKESGLDKINSDDENDSDDGIVDELERDIEEIEEVLVSIADVIGSLFNTHKELTLDVVGKLLNEYLPRYFEDKASTFEKKMGLFILDDMVEFLGQNLLDKIWTDIAKILLRFPESKETELRQASCYGLGEFAKHTVKDFNLYINDILNALNTAINYSSDGQDEEEWGHARDNAISAIGKIIKHQHANLDVNVWIPTWLSYLPLKWDPQEAKAQHELLCEILISENSRLVLGNNNENLPKIIRILAKVYDTKYTTDESNKHILTVFENIKNNPSLHEFVRLAKENCEAKILKKLVIHFP